MSSLNRSLALVAALQLALPPPTGARNVGREPLPELLAEFEGRLHALGIDVTAANFGARPRRVKVGPLSAYASAASSPEGEPQEWARELDFLIAVPDRPDVPRLGDAQGQAEEHARLLALWRKAPSNRRVFVAFAGRDAEHAARVSKALADGGYVAFTYLRAESTLPDFSPEQLRYYFESAENHWVIDTPNARHSSGVAHEVAMLGRLRETGTVLSLQGARRALRALARKHGLSLDTFESLEPDVALRVASAERLEQIDHYLIPYGLSSRPEFSAFTVSEALELTRLYALAGLLDPGSELGDAIREPLDASASEVLETLPDDVLKELDFVGRHFSVDRGFPSIGQQRKLTRANMQRGLAVVAFCLEHDVRTHLVPVVASKVATKGARTTMEHVRGYREHLYGPRFHEPDSSLKRTERIELPRPWRLPRVEPRRGSTMRAL